MISKKISIFLLLILSTIHTSKSRCSRIHNHHFEKDHKCKCSENSGSQINEKYNKPQERGLNVIPFIESNVWLNNAKNEPKTVNNVEQRDRFQQYPQTSPYKEFGYSIPSNTYNFNNVPKRRYHFAPAPRVLSNEQYNIPSFEHHDHISAYPKDIEDKELQYKIPFNVDSKKFKERLAVIPPSRQIMSIFDLNKIDEHRDHVSTPLQIIPNMGKANHRSYILTPPHIIQRGESKYNFPSYYKNNNFNKYQSHIPVYPQDEEFEYNVVSNNYDVQKMAKQRADKAAQTISIGNSVPSNIYDINKIAKNRHHMNSQIIPNQESQYSTSVDHKMFNEYQNHISANPKVIPDEGFKYHIPSNYETIKFDEQRDRIPVYQPDEKLKYFTPSNLNKFDGLREINSAPHIIYSNGVPYEAPFVNPGQEKFNKWILQQIKIINNNRNREQDKIDMKDVEKSILQILKKNGMSITAKGMLIDSHGSVLDIHNLSLIPILVQNPVSLGKLLERNGGRLAKQKQQLPYLQAILVIVTHPSKILGVMPIKKKKLTFGTEKYRLDEVENEKDVRNDIFPYYSANTKLKQPKTNNLDVDYTNEEEIRILSRRGAPDDIFSYPFSKTRNVLEQEEIDAGRIFFPNFEQKLEIVSRDRDRPLTITAKEYRDSAKVQIPNMFQHLVELSFENHNALNNIEGAQNNIAIGIPKTFTRSNSVPVSSAFGEDSDPIQTLRKLSPVDVSSKSKDLYKAMGKPIGNNRRFQINAPFPSSDSLAIFNTLGKHGVSFDKVIPKTIKFNTMPLDNLERFGIPVTQNQDIPDFVYPSESDISSRSELSSPEIPAQNDSNSIQVPDALVETEDDDDDGDFRIIGGNAATGSGTPLSNRGRSGRFY